MEIRIGLDPDKARRIAHASTKGELERIVSLRYWRTESMVAFEF
jgi:hypothetical protein